MSKPHQCLWGRHLACPENTRDGQDAHPTKLLKSSPTYTSGSQSSQAGFTIIESLVALIVAAILLSAIAPILVLSTASRVQARRVELATQAARSYIDGVRKGAITLPPAAAAGTNINAYPAPTDISTLYCVDVANLTPNVAPTCNANNPKQLVVQGFRSSNDSAQGYQLGVRVYRSDAFLEPPLLTNTPNRVTQRTFTGTIGSRRAPLVEMTTDVAPAQNSFDNFCTRLKQSPIYDATKSRC